MSGGSGGSRGRVTGPSRPGSAGAVGATVDLDAPAPSPPLAAAAPSSRRRRRGPVVWVVVAALVGAGLGAAATSRHAAAREQVRAEADRRERAVLALAAGAPSLVRGAGAPDGPGRSALTLSVPLSNRGADPLRVGVLGLDAPDQPTAERPPSLALSPGATVAALVPMVVRCAQVLPTSIQRGARRTGSSRLRVRVESSGGARETTLPLVEPSGGTVADIASYACGPPEERRAPVSVTRTPRDDGSLEVTVAAPLLGVPLTLGLVQSPGLGVSGDPALPRTTSPERGASLVLTMDPACSQAPPGQVTTASLQVVTLAGGRVQAVVPDDDGVQAAWTARRLALRCG